MSEIKSSAAAKRPPRQPRTGLTSTGARKAGSKSDRSRAREFALQGLYQSLVSGNPIADIDTFTRDLAGFNKADSAPMSSATAWKCRGAWCSTSALNWPRNLVAPTDTSM